MSQALRLAFYFLVVSPGGIRAGELENRSFRGTDYQVVSADPGSIRLHWKDGDGKAIGTLAKLAKSLQADGQKVGMVTNAGIYTPSPAPEGLHVQESEPLVPLNQKAGNGNFYLLPNGVFFVDKNNRARVLPTSDYAKLKIAPRLATQSGPILVSGGKLHPKFNRDSQSKKLRSGVGVDKDGKVWFVCVHPDRAGNATNFFNFAEFFLRELGCQQALYLDGTISRMATGEGADTTRQPVAFAGMLSVSVQQEREEDAAD